MSVLGGLGKLRMGVRVEVWREIVKIWEDIKDMSRLGRVVVFS